MTTRRAVGFLLLLMTSLSIVVTRSSSSVVAPSRGLRIEGLSAASDRHRSEQRIVVTFRIVNDSSFATGPFRTAIAAKRSDAAETIRVQTSDLAPGRTSYASQSFFWSELCPGLR